MNTGDTELRLLLHAYLDQELSAEEVSQFEERLRTDPQLRQALEDERAFRDALRAHVCQTHAPPTLRAHVEALITSGHRAVERRLASTWWNRMRAWLHTLPSTPRWIIAAYTVLVLLAIGSGVWMSRTVWPAEKKHTVFRQLGGKHVVYTTGEPVLDVEGSAEEIADWFRSRAPWPVRVPQISGWRLVGGRLGEFHHQPLVYLLYERQGNYLGLLLFVPREDDFPPDARRDLNGQATYLGVAWERPVLVWREEDVGYALVGYAGQPIEDVERIFRTLSP
ncbi:MAG: hypothetical protein Q9O62_08545 [Ardenticatenia bacterium]|nr:hypothetical protein [Ardenticatenia bacterium]